jgi:hypothetical protein
LKICWCITACCQLNIILLFNTGIPCFMRQLF